MSCSKSLRWVWMLGLLLGLSSLACITSEIGFKVVPKEGGRGEASARVAMHFTDAYLAAARSANAERAQDYQQAGLEAPENLFPETFQELEDGGLSPDEFTVGDETEIIEQSDRGFTVVGSGEYDEKESSDDWPLEVKRDDPEWVFYIFTMEIEDMSSEMDLSDLDQLRAEGLGPKPPIETSDDSSDPDAEDDLGSLLVTGVLEEILGSTSEMSVDLDGWYAKRVLLASGLPVMTYWVELPGEIVSHQINGQPAGTVDSGTNRATLVIDEAYQRAHPEGTGGEWRVESRVHVCDEGCSTEPHMIWDEISGPDECICTCESGWTLDETGQACVEEEAEQPKHFIGNPANLEAMLRARGYSEAHCPAGAAYPTGAVFLWNLGGGVAHSSVMTADNRQIEMGHKSGGKKYISEHLPAGQNPTAFRGPYAVTRVLCPPPGYSFNLPGAVSMAGLDRNYKEGKPNEWNCHGFSANVTARYAQTGVEIKPGSKYRWEGNRLILEQGEVHVRDNKAIQVEVVNGKVHHHSEFVVVARDDGTTQIAVLAGEVTFEGPEQSVTLHADQSVEVDPAGTPSTPASSAQSRLDPWWRSGDLVEPVYREPSLEEFRAFELGEIEELPGLAEKESGGLDIPNYLILACGAALGLAVLVLAIGGVVVWRLRRRKKVSTSPVTLTPPQPAARQSFPFIQAERRLAELGGEYHAGRLDRAAYEAALQELMVQDERGQYWALSGEDGAWYRHDGSTWVRGEPPR